MPKKGVVGVNIFLFSCIILIFLYFFIGYFPVGNPDSPLVDFYGQNLENFVEYEKAGTVSIPEEIATIIFFKKTYELYESAGDVGDKSYLILKYLSDETETVMFQGDLGANVNKLVIDKENRLLFYLLEPSREDYGNAYLIVYDLESMQEVSKTLILDRTKYSGYVFKMIYDEIVEKLLFEINYKLDDIWYDGMNHLSYDIQGGSLMTISQEFYDERIAAINPEDTFVYKDQDCEKYLFEVFPQYDTLSANYKTKYNGLYLSDGTNNIRLTEDGGVGCAMFWLDNGKYVITDYYLYDTSGKMQRLQIADGGVLAVY